MLRECCPFCNHDIEDIEQIDQTTGRVVICSRHYKKCPVIVATKTEFSCKCGYSTSKKSNLIRHEKTHIRNIHICKSTACMNKKTGMYKSFKTEDRLLEHLHKYHSDYHCNICTVSFHTSNEYKEHICEPDKNYTYRKKDILIHSNPVDDMSIEFEFDELNLNNLEKQTCIEVAC